MSKRKTHSNKELKDVSILHESVLKSPKTKPPKVIKQNTRIIVQPEPTQEDLEESLTRDEMCVPIPVFPITQNIDYEHYLALYSDFLKLKEENRQLKNRPRSFSIPEPEPEEVKVEPEPEPEEVKVEHEPEPEPVQPVQPVGQNIQNIDLQQHLKLYADYVKVKDENITLQRKIITLEENLRIIRDRKTPKRKKIEGEELKNAIIDAILNSNLNIEAIPDEIEREIYGIIIDQISKTSSCLSGFCKFFS